jgi:hypothetical protein
MQQEHNDSEGDVLTVAIVSTSVGHPMSLQVVSIELRVICDLTKSTSATNDDNQNKVSTQNKLSSQLSLHHSTVLDAFNTAMCSSLVN